MNSDSVLQKKHALMSEYLYELLISTDKSEEYGPLFNSMGLSLRRTTHSQLRKIADYFADFILQELDGRSKAVSDVATDKITADCLNKALEKFINEQEESRAGKNHFQLIR